MSEENTTTELQEVVLLPQEPVSEDPPEENPKLKQFTAGVSWESMAGGVAGAMAAGIVPKVLKWNTGLKDVAASLAATLVGGYLVSKWNKQAAMGWVIGGSIITIVKGIRVVMKRPAGGSLLGDDLIYDVGDYDWDEDYEEFYMGDEDDIFTEEELFGLGEDPIIPTANVDDF